MTLNISYVHRRVLVCNSHILVTGGPGSGKTTLALLKGNHRLQAGLRPGESILFLSFSRAAVARIREASQLQLNKTANKLLSIQTYHSFFWEILRTFGYLLGAPKKLTLLTPYDERALSGGLKPGKEGWNDWCTTRELLFLKEGNTAFDLFAPKVFQLVDRSKSIASLVAKRFPLIIVDEAQDTGTDQWNILKSLCPYTQLLFLADLDQQIYDFIPGVGPKRIEEIRQELNPSTFPLGSQNNRSPGTEILDFANDILDAKVSKSKYKGVSQMNFNPSAEHRDKVIRQSVGYISKLIKDSQGRTAENICMLASFDSGVNIISTALRNGQNPIQHKVLFDETVTLLSSRLLAFLMEPKLRVGKNQDIANVLSLMTSIYRAHGTAGKLKESDKFNEWRLNLLNDEKVPTTKLFKGLDQLIITLQSQVYTGDPGKDWMSIRYLLRNSQVKEFEQVDRDLQYLMAFNRGKIISAGLSELWSRLGNYTGARKALDSALAEEQILSGIEDLTGIHVMTIHKSKGKQFDGVILFRSKNQSPFLWREDVDPHPKSRKILRVGITRAKCHVLILNEAFPNCPLLSKYSI
jgi:DNA helicase-2/ATP-dependent DNA helicase PcrA